MALETYNTLIARNKRNSAILVAIIIVLFVAVGFSIGTYTGHGDQRFGVGVAVFSGVLAFLLTLISFYGGSAAILAISGAHELQREEDPQLFNVVEELCLASALPMPKIYLMDDATPNAFATGRDPQHAVVAITAGLRSKLTREELQGVLAHELSHVRNLDIRFSMLVAMLVGVLVMLCDLFLHNLWWGGGRSRDRSDSDRGGGGAQVVFLVIAIALAIIAPILAKLIQMAISRQREYLADASAVEMTRNPYGLIGALEKISNDPGKLESANRATQHLYIVNPLKKFNERSSALMSTHPPLEDRIERLKALTV